MGILVDRIPGMPRMERVEIPAWQGIFQTEKAGISTVSPNMKSITTYCWKVILASLLLFPFSTSWKGLVAQEPEPATPAAAAEKETERGGVQEARTEVIYLRDAEGNLVPVPIFRWKSGTRSTRHGTTCWDGNCPLPLPLTRWFTRELPGRIISCWM